MKIVVRVTKPAPSIVLTKGNVVAATTGASLGVEGTVSPRSSLLPLISSWTHMISQTYTPPPLQCTVSPQTSQQFPFWDWRQTKVSVRVEYNGESEWYLLEAGNLGIFRGPESGGLEVWSWKKELITKSHPAL